VNRQFTALSGLAIALVVINHSVVLDLAIPPEFGYPQSYGWGYTILTTIGSFAVPTFLFISGCFFAYAAHPKLSYKVVRNNLSRLLIPYLIWSIVFYILIWIGQGKVFTIWGYIKNLIVGYPFWFVPLMAFYYLISPILVILGKRFGWAIIAVFGLYQLVLINILYPGTLGFSFPEWMKFLAPPVLRSTLVIWGIYFPLGLIYGLNARSIKPWIEKYKWLLVAVTGFMLVCMILHTISIISFPLAGFIGPLTFVMITPIIQRNSIPFVRTFEKLGKRSYGLYLVSWNVLYFAIVSIHGIAPWLYNYQIPFYFLLMVLGFVIPLWSMNILERLPTRVVFNYVFG
jgi:peptidoglycan/LPS O-acetylase OafA/YrhL